MPWTTNVPIPNQKSKSTPALTPWASGLAMVHAGESSNDIWFSTSDGSTWTPNVKIPDQRSKAPSAIAEFGGRLHIVHLGDSENQLWHSSFDGTRWTTNAKIEGEASAAPVALAAFGGRLHCLHRGSSSTRIYHLEFDGTRWTKRGPDAGLDGQRSKGAPALAVVGGVLHMVHQGDTSNDLWHATFADATGWSVNAKIPDQQSKSAPALAELGGLLHLLHLGDTSNHLWHSTFDGSWADNVSIPYQLSFAAPGLATLGAALHMVHTGDSEKVLWHSTSDGVLVRRPERRVVVLDLDGLRWDVFRRHLKTARDGGGGLSTTYRFELPDGASDDTILGDGKRDLNSAFAELCFAEGNGMVDVRLALTSYPSFTFPTHATMYTGTWPSRHGIAGHKFVVRDAPPEWDRHQWDALPRALALQGYCTDETGSWGAFWDWVWGGFDQVGPNSCTNRNRGLVSDLREPTVFTRAQAAGLRTCAIHAFYHGADAPWTAEGKDEWWHYDAGELRSIKDICSDEDVDQLERADHGALTKASLLLRMRPSTVRVTPPGPVPAQVGYTATGRDGNPVPQWRVDGEPHPDGIPDLISIYLASIDESSHVDGPRNQETYLAWFDHRLARFARELRAADPDAWEKTVFAVVADHGHIAIANAPDTSGLPASNVEVVRTELLRMLAGDEAAEETVEALRKLHVDVAAFLDEIMEDKAYAWAEAMNLYVYLRDPAVLDTLTVARRLLGKAMRTEAYGALVLIGEEYQFLARGDERPVPVGSQTARRVILRHLDVPGLVTPDIAAVSLDGADETAETALRTLLDTPAAFDLLRVVERVRGYHPVAHRSTPDIVLLAPAGRSFTTSPSTHGSFAYGTSRIPMAFFGPGMPDGRVTLDTADLVDFTPTVLSLLHVVPGEVDGQPVVDGEGRPRRRSAERPAPPERPKDPPRGTPRAKPERRPGFVVELMTRMQDATSPKAAAHLPPVLVQVSVEERPVAPRDVAVGRAAHATVTSFRAIGGADDLRVEVDGVDRVEGRGPVTLPPGATARVASGRSRAEVTVASEYLIVPVRITVPRMPRWLTELVQESQRRSLLALDDGPASSLGGALLSGEQLVRAVEGLEGLLAEQSLVTTRCEDPSERWDERLAGAGRPRRRPRSDDEGTELERLDRALRRLPELLSRDLVAGLSVLEPHC